MGLMGWVKTSYPTPASGGVKTRCTNNNGSSKPKVNKGLWSLGPKIFIKSHLFCWLGVPWIPWQTVDMRLEKAAHRGFKGCSHCGYLRMNIITKMLDSPKKNLQPIFDEMKMVYQSSTCTYVVSLYVCIYIYTNSGYMQCGIDCCEQGMVGASHFNWHYRGKTIIPRHIANHVIFQSGPISKFCADALPGSPQRSRIQNPKFKTIHWTLPHDTNNEWQRVIPEKNTTKSNCSPKYDFHFPCLGPDDQSNSLSLTSTAGTFFPCSQKSLIQCCQN